MCYVDLGLPLIKYLVKPKQCKFSSEFMERQPMRGSPWGHFVKIVLESGTTTGRYIISSITNSIDDVSQGKDAIKLSISNFVSSRRMIYKTKP